MGSIMRKMQSTRNLPVHSGQESIPATFNIATVKLFKSMKPSWRTSERKMGRIVRTSCDAV